MSDDGVVQIHGKEYKTIASRNATFRTLAKYKGYSGHTEILEADERKVIMRAFIKDPNGQIVATGHAEEVRGSSNINTTSALENCETSAYGRCLAFLDPELAGSEIASADEVAQAISQQNEREIYARAKEHMAAVMDNLVAVETIKENILAAEPVETTKGQFEFKDEANLSVAIEAWSEMDRETCTALWLAPSKGGCFTTLERAVMKSDRWAQLSREAK